MNPEISPAVPEFMPQEHAAPFIAEARETVRETPVVVEKQSVVLPGRFTVWRDAMLVVTIALALFTAGAGLLYIIDLAPAMAITVIVVAVAMALSWLAYFLAVHRLEDRVPK